MDTGQDVLLNLTTLWGVSLIPALIWIIILNPIKRTNSPISLFGMTIGMLLTAPCWAIYSVFGLGPTCLTKWHYAMSWGRDSKHLEHKKYWRDLSVFDIDANANGWVAVGTFISVVGALILLICMSLDCGDGKPHACNYIADGIRHVLSYAGNMLAN
jgi:hypothetical protein